MGTRTDFIAQIAKLEDMRERHRLHIERVRNRKARQRIFDLELEVHGLRNELDQTRRELAALAAYVAKGDAPKAAQKLNGEAKDIGVAAVTAALATPSQFDSVIAQAVLDQAIEKGIVEWTI
jgi:alkylhydroperoxidase/carboxymuconolactone decarboxylase family protein YurZ